MNCSMEHTLSKVDAFIAAHPEYSRDVPQLGQGSTNHVVYARRGDTNVIFKHCCDVGRKERECFGMRHWHDTNLVAKLQWDCDQDMVLITHIPGTWLHRAKDVDGEEAWRSACRESGKAIAALTMVPLSVNAQNEFQTRFYEERTFEDYARKILRLGRSVHALDPGFQHSYWNENLDFIENCLGAMLAEPPVLYHQDVGNFHVQAGRFMGFFDVESCRIGCASMQFGSSLLLPKKDDGSWALFREGWEEQRGAKLTTVDRACAAAGNHLLVWRWITRYLSYDGTPGSGFDWASPADPQSAKECIDGVNEMLGI